MRITITILLLFFTAFSLQATNYYTKKSGNWNSQASWVNKNKPGWIGNNDTVFINHTMTSNSNIEIGSGGVVIISSTGSLNGNGDIQINSGAKLSSDGPIDMDNLNVYGGEFNSTSDVYLDGGLNTSSLAQISIDGDFTINDPGWQVELDSTSLFVGGDFTMNNGNLKLTGSSVLDVQGNTSLSGDLTLNGTSDATFNNDLTMNNGNLKLTNSAVLDVQGNTSLGGNLTLYGTSDATFNNNTLISGDLTMTTNTKLTNNGSMTINGNVTTNGSSEIDNNNTMTTNGTVDNNSTINNSGTWNANADFTNSWSGNLTNSGDLNISGELINHNVIDNTGYIETTSDLTNSGTLINNGTTFVDGNVDNSGTISGSGQTLITGTLDNSGGGQVTGDGYVCNPDGSTDPTSGNQSNVDSTVSICGQTDDDPFPVELIEFEAETQDGNVNLQWATASEINNDFFSVQRSTNNEEFNDIATVEGAGNSNKIINYQYTDRNCPATETVYYRIKQTDFDGTTTYSWTVDVMNEEAMVVNVFPNPVIQGNQVTIQSSEKDILIKVYDRQGKQLKNIEQNMNQNTINTRNMKPGIYFIKIIAPYIPEPITKKIIVN